MRIVWTEFSLNGSGPVRIFANMKQAVQSIAWDAGLIKEIPRAEAVGAIRHKVFERDNHACTHCGAPLIFPQGHSNSMHMHEKQWRGRGGEVSVDNCTSLCADCHLNDETAGHGKRKPQWSKRPENSIADAFEF